MDWTMHEGYGIPIGLSLSHGAPQEVSPVSFTFGMLIRRRLLPQRRIDLTTHRLPHPLSE